jgi:hypothetical protein
VAEPFHLAIENEWITLHEKMKMKEVEGQEFNGGGKAVDEDRERQ